MDTQRILIFAKTYPELSTRYRETVCTGGCTEDGKPIRIYPVPIRYLPLYNRYSLYTWIEAPIRKSEADARPESFRIVDPRAIRLLDTLPTKRGWLERRKVIFRDRSWHYDCLEELKELRRRDSRSLGLVGVSEVVGVDLVQKKEEERREHEEKLRNLQAAGNLFDARQKNLEFLPFRVRLRWRCGDPGRCLCRTDKPHSATVMDWGLGELGRREGAEQALRKMEDIANLKKHDLRLFMGNLKSRQHIFGIVGLWAPLRRDVEKHPLQPSLFDPTETAAPPPARDDESQLDFL